MRGLGKIFRDYVDGVTMSAAKNAAAGMVYELVAQLQAIGKERQALDIVDRLGEMQYTFALLDHSGRLFIEQRYAKHLNADNFKKVNGHYVSNINAVSALQVLGRFGFSVVNASAHGAGYDYLLQKRVYSVVKPQ